MKLKEEDWLPIEEAPKDGTIIIARGNNYGDPEQGTHIVITHWSNDNFRKDYHWTSIDNDEGNGIHTHLTHFQELPQVKILKEKIKLLESELQHTKK